MTQSILMHEISPEDLRELISQEVSKLQYNPDKFENVIVPADWFCKIHNISKITLQRWIDQGVITPESEAGKHHKFSLAYILKFDVAAIKRRRNKLSIMNTNKFNNNAKKNLS